MCTVNHDISKILKRGCGVMSIAVPQPAKNENCTSMVCVDSYKEEVMAGRIFHVCYQEPLKFHGLVSFLKTVEGILNYLDKPQANMQQRRFREVLEEKEQLNQQKILMHRNIPDSRGGMATFKIRIAFRQNASWQGTIYWMEEEKEENFRSVLELIMLISDTLQDMKETDS